METFFWGKPLVHAHFAESSPVLPFVEYGSAWPGFSPGELKDSLLAATERMKSDNDRLLDGQRAFLRDHAGPCDGKATERVISFLEEVL